MNEREINLILALYWDPLLTVARGGFQNEYRTYAKRVTRMLSRGAGVDEITQYLYRVEN